MGIQWYTGVYKGILGCIRVYWGIQGFTRVYRGMPVGIQGYTKVYKGSKRYYYRIAGRLYVFKKND